MKTYSKYSNTAIPLDLNLTYYAGSKAQKDPLKVAKKRKAARKAAKKSLKANRNKK